MNKRILVVDDDEAIRELVCTGLMAVGYEVFPFGDGKQVVETVSTKGIDLAIVDMILPDTNGLDLVKRIRQQPNVGIIVLSAQDHLADRIVALEIGADDYVIKPFQFRELLARVHSVLRRVNGIDGAPSNAEAPPTYEFDGWYLDPSSYCVRRPDGTELPLTTGEFKVLEFLVTHPNRYWDANELSRMITADGAPTAITTVMSRIKRLRSRMGENARDPRFIGTVRGSGYKFLPKVLRVEG